MTKDLTVSKNMAALVIFLMCCLFPLKGWAQTGEAAVNALIESGFEDVGWTENEEERIYVLQNTAYRLQALGLAKAIDIIQKSGLPVAKNCRIVVTENNVPQLSLSYRPTAGEDSSHATVRDWDVSYDLGSSRRELSKIDKKNRSLYKIDIVVYPDFSFQNLLITQIYQVLFNISPAVEVSMWKGMRLTAQVIFPVYNEYGDSYKQVRQGYMTLSQTVRMPYNTFLKGTVGIFNNRRWGVDLSARHHLVKDSRFSFEARLGYTGVSYVKDFAWHISPLKRWTWTLGGSYYWTRFNTEFSLKVEQYLLGEKGVRFDVMRNFRYASIGFYAMDLQKASSNGGFYVQIMLPPYGRHKRKHVRITPAKYFGLLYNAGNEVYYGKNYTPELGTSYAYRNNFSPYYIKSELRNY